MSEPHTTNPPLAEIIRNGVTMKKYDNEEIEKILSEREIPVKLLAVTTGKINYWNILYMSPKLISPRMVDKDKDCPSPKKL